MYKKLFGVKGKKKAAEVVAAPAASVQAPAPTPEPAPPPAPKPTPEPAPALAAEPPTSEPVQAVPAPIAPPPADPAPIVVSPTSAPSQPATLIKAPPRPTPPPRPTRPPRKNVASTPAKSAAVVTAQGIAEDDKISTTLPGGFPVPDWHVPRSTLPKDPHFTDIKPYTFLQELAELAPAGLLASAIGDVRDLAAAHLDEKWVQNLQIIDQRSKGMAQGQVQHALGAALAQELATYQAEKYGPRGVTFYRDFQTGETPNEIVLITHAELLDGINSRTGSWTAKWKIVAQNTVGVSEAEISGEVKCRAWCYEACSVHMSAGQTFPPAHVEGDADDDLPLSKVLMMQIKEWENSVLEALDAVYGEEMDGTLKAIRRTLPITRTRLKWELIAQRAIKRRQHKKK